jgi:outer membrane receptor protein involved in Fe transport
MRLKRRKLSLVPTLLATAIASPLALGQSSGFLEEVIVTAEKRETSLQDTAIAVSAFSGDELDRQQITNALDIQMNVPNMLMSKGNFTGANISIRGIGTNAVGSSADSGTGIHLNGVYLNSSRIFEAEFYDTERVEVLRGPQGTLYGRNTTAGVVNVITKKPTEEMEGFVEMQLGNYGTKKFKGAFNMPLTDTLSTRIAGFSLERDGYTKNVYDNSYIDDRDMYSIRWTTLWQATENTDVTLMVHHFNEDDNRMRGQKQACTKDPDGILGCLPGSLGYETTNGAATITGSLLGALPIPFPADDYANSVNPKDLRKVNMDFKPTYEADETVTSLEINHDIGDLTLTSVTGYSDSSFNGRDDYDKSVASEVWPIPVTMALPSGYDDVTVNYAYGADESSSDPHQFSQEFRLASNYDGDVNFLLGGFYLTYENENHYYVYNSGLALFGQLTGLPENQHFYDNHTLSYQLDTSAVFGELYWSVNEKTDVTLGLRYTDEEKESTQRTVYLGFLSNPNVAGGGYESFGNDWQETTGKANINYHLNEEIMLYATLARSYKSGGFNTLSADSPLLDPVTGDPDLAYFEPEFINSLEVGAKTRLLDNTLQANFTAFYYDYEDMQVSKIIAQSSVNENVDSTIYGLESELLYAPDENWTFSWNVAYLNSEVSDFSSVDPTDPNQMGTTDGILSVFGNNVLAADGSPGIEADLDGNQLQQSPEWSTTVGVSYNMMLSNGMGLQAGTTYYWQDEYYARNFNTANDVIDSWSVWNASVMLTSADESWYAEAFVKNISDDANVTGQYTTDAVSGLFTNQFILEPRTYGLTVGYNF